MRKEARGGWGSETGSSDCCSQRSLTPPRRAARAADARNLTPRDAGEAVNPQPAGVQPPPRTAAAVQPPPRSTTRPPIPESKPWPSLATAKGKGGRGSVKGSAPTNQNSVGQWDLWCAFNAGKSKGMGQGIQQSMCRANEHSVKGYGGRGKGKGMGMYGRGKAGKGVEKSPQQNQSVPQAVQRSSGEGAPEPNSK